MVIVLLFSCNSSNSVEKALKLAGQDGDKCQLYGITGDKKNELIMANKILVKPVKIMSPTITQIKNEVKKNMEN